MSEKITMLKTKEIHEDFGNRDILTHTDLFELAKSIKENGVLSPLIVRALPDEDKYQIVAGHRRFAAAKVAEQLDAGKTAAEKAAVVKAAADAKTQTPRRVTTKPPVPRQNALSSNAQLRLMRACLEDPGFRVMSV